MQGVIEVSVGVLVVVGLAGIAIPLLPGLWLVAIAVAFWGFYVGGAWGIAVAVITISLSLFGTVLKFLLPGRRLRDEDVPTRTFLWGVLLATIGLFAVPILGAPLGFVLGIYLAQRGRVGKERAWTSTKTALVAVGWSVGIELLAGLMIAATWAIGLLAT